MPTRRLESSSAGCTRRPARRHQIVGGCRPPAQKHVQVVNGCNIRKWYAEREFCGKDLAGRGDALRTNHYAMMHFLPLCFLVGGGGFTVETMFQDACSQITADRNSQTARMASSKTVFKPFCVNAEHSRYFTAPMSFAI